MNARQRAKKWKRLAQENQRTAREYDDLVYQLRLAHHELAVMEKQWIRMKRTIIIDNMKVPPEFRDDVAKTKLERELAEFLSKEGCIKKRRSFCSRRNMRLNSGSGRKGRCRDDGRRDQKNRDNDGEGHEA